jgi:hypothetical protein
MERRCRQQADTMRFTCAFAHPDRRAEEIEIAVELTADEIKAINCLRRDGDPHVEIKVLAYALRHAYQIAPSGFQHIKNGIRQVMVN